MTGRWLAFVLWLFSTVALAADPPATAPAPRTPPATPPAQAASTAATVPPAPPAPAAATEAGKDAPAAGDKPPASRATSTTPQRFTPTDKVRADFPVSFPIDI
jgi:Meckel syndrome type 1 protein